jgi:hypothetical protein
MTPPAFVRMAQGELVQRLTAALEAAGLEEEAAIAPGMQPEAAGPSEQREQGVPGVAPGTAGLGKIATAEVCTLPCCRMQTLHHGWQHMHPMMHSPCKSCNVCAAASWWLGCMQHASQRALLSSRTEQHNKWK